MAEGMPKVFRKSPEVVSTYDFLDVISGTGYTILFLGRTGGAPANATGCILSNHEFYAASQTAYSTGFNETPSAIATSNASVNFDVLLQKPLVIQGKAIFQCSFATKISNAAITAKVKMKVHLKKWDGTTATTIATSAFSDESSTTSVIYTDYKFFTANLDIAAATLIKRGEYVRVTVDFYGYNSAGGHQWYGIIACDPEARTTSIIQTDTAADNVIANWNASYPSDAQMMLPIRVDI